MNCREFESVLADLASDRRMDEAARLLGLAHTETCTRCATLLAEERTLLAGLHAAVPNTEFETAPPWVERELRLAFRQRAMASSNSAVISRPPGIRQRPLWVLGAVALIMGALALSLLFRQRVPKSEPPQQVRRSSAPTSTRPVSEPPPSPPSAAVQQRPSGAAETVLAPAKRAHRPERRNAKGHALHRPKVGRELMAGSPGAENTTDFLPLGYGPAPDRLERGQIVRIRLPRMTLVSFGLPMNEARAREPIDAEVVLGEDGTARAIRFVH